MSTIPEKIMEKFLSDLAESDDVTDEQISALKELLAKKTKPKGAEIESVFSVTEDDQL